MYLYYFFEPKGIVPYTLMQVSKVSLRPIHTNSALLLTPLPIICSMYRQGNFQQQHPLCIEYTVNISPATPPDAKMALQQAV